MRLGFDLHDGPIQDVLALAADVHLLQEQVYPFVLEKHRDQAAGRFDDLTARLVELDRDLREIAHSLETKSVVSRPLGEILHREIDAFSERTGIQTNLEIRGEGSILGLRQAGPTDLRVARLSRDRKELAQARGIARRALREDPRLLQPEHLLLRASVLERFSDFPRLLDG